MNTVGVKKDVVGEVKYSDDFSRCIGDLMGCVAINMLAHTRRYRPNI